MFAIFDGCQKFKQKLNKWNITNVKNQDGMFNDTPMSFYSGETIVKMNPLDYYPKGYIEPLLDTISNFRIYQRVFEEKLNNEVLDDIKKKVSNDIDFEYIDEIFDYINEKLLQIIEESVSDRNKINIEEINDKIKKIMIDFKRKITENNKTKITERVLYTLVIYILENITNQTPDFKEYFINEFISNYNNKENIFPNFIFITMTGIDGVFERLNKCFLEAWKKTTDKFKDDNNISKTNMGGRKHKMYKTLKKIKVYRRSKKFKRRYKKTRKNNKLRK
jgi:hypothetical protein